MSRKWGLPFLDFIMVLSRGRRAGFMPFAAGAQLIVCISSGYTSLTIASHRIIPTWTAFNLQDVQKSSHRFPTNRSHVAPDSDAMVPLGSVRLSSSWCTQEKHRTAEPPKRERARFQPGEGAHHARSRHEDVADATHEYDFTGRSIAQPEGTSQRMMGRLKFDS